MWYKIKRDFYYYLKCIDVYFRTKRKYREIAKAYYYKKLTAGKRLSITPSILVRGSIGIFLLSIIFIVTIINSDKIALRIKAESTRIRKNIISTDSNTSTTPFEVSNNSIKIRNNKNKDESIPEDRYTERMDTFDLHEKIENDWVDSDQDHSLLSFNSLIYMIYTNKWNRQLHLLKKDNERWSTFRTYKIAIGENIGRKMKVGDKKTPEGLYFIIGRKESNELPSMYGPLAFVLNYPNEEDRKDGRTGSGIWIHGTNHDSIPIQTKGCLEMNNEDLNELAEILKSGIGTPIKIVDINNTYNPFMEINFSQVYQKRKKILSGYLKKRDFFITILKTWEDAWESKDIEEYSTCYYPDRFFSQGLNWDAWKQKKERTFKLYKMIEISLDRIFLADYSDSIAVVKFVQAYKSDKINVVNGKKLLFVNNNGTWKIFRENTFPKEEHLL